MKSLSSLRLVAPLLLLAAVASGCKADPDEEGSGGSAASTGTTTASTGTGEASGGGDAGGGDPGNGGAGGQGGDPGPGPGAGGSGGNPVEGGWTQLVLLEGEDSFHDQDDITAIYFSDLDTGLVGTNASDVSALYKATATEITAFAVPEPTFTDPPGALGDFGVLGIAPTSAGISVWMDTSGALLTSDDDFETFALESTGLEYGIAPMTALLEGPDGYVALVGTGVVATSSEAPAPGVEWEETWAPDGIPTTPSPFPEDGCAYGPRTRYIENLYQTGSMSPDGQTVIYVGNSQESGGEHVVCVSSDGGVFFDPHVIEVGEEASAIGPSVARMISDTVGFVATSDFSSGEGGTASIWKTDDAGETWTKTTIPAEVNEAVAEIASIFFAPGGQVGYAVGQFGAADGPLLLKTTDGGDTWVEPSGVNELRAALEAAGTFGRLYTGFALDEDNIWVGGDHAGLFYSANGAED